MSDEPIFFGDASEQGMRTATGNAHKTFKFFWRELSWEYRRIIPGLDLAAVKVAFPVKKGLFGKRPDAEQMWINEVQFDGRKIRGVLLNNPQWVKGIKAGSAVTIEANEMTDWMYAMEGKVYGAFTVQVMRQAMPPQERVAHDDAWGLDFGDPQTVCLAPRPVKNDDGEISTDASQPVTNASQLERVEHPMSINMKPQAKEMLAKRPELATTPDDESWTMLQRESLAGNATSVYVLLKYGRADKTAINPYGETAVDLAKKMGWPKVLEVLEKY